jgi:uncharacterized protein
MGSRTFETGRVIVARLEHGSDLLLALTGLAREHGLDTAGVTAIGALSGARLAFYDQEAKSYGELAFAEPLEIAGCLGTVSRRDGDTAVHAHITLTREDGSAIGGHLVAGCTVFACEATLTELLGERLERGYDETTGLPLWQGL